MLKAYMNPLKTGRGHRSPDDTPDDIRRWRAELELMSALAEGEASARKCGWVSMDTAMKKLGV
jgi:hypothetical protein